ncbi:MAG: outer rane receptor protein [Hydrocarboniphaga sp.]|uniref:TonB-dependent receptor n=1 Tax=Hydrocarboniphaga sp. TaxID=2033016 RepID=UPI0026149F9E|nr:TonB-dependent receptor [Hydrocarboniphaga sp.]MDB5969890.1 outer rane receptor protein [Hydrocarboniphaga sp.]
MKKRNARALILATLAGPLPLMTPLGVPAQMESPAAASDASPDGAATAGTPSEPEQELGSIPVSSGEAQASGEEIKRSAGVESIGIEEVVVTAQKRAESIQSVPISISAFTSEQLATQGVSNSASLATKIPAMSFDSVANFAIIYIRGVGTDAFLPSADLSVATYIDGVNFPISFGLARALGSIERIEILKGPQGTLFGRNSTGGAINIVTRDPTPDFTGEYNGQASRFGEFDNRVFVSGPIVDTLSASISVVANRSDEYYKLADSSPLESLNPNIDLGANLKLKWAPTDWFEAIGSGFYISSKATGTALLPNVQPSTLGALLGARASPDYQTSVNVKPYSNGDLGVGSLTLNGHPGPFDIKSITAYQDYRAYANQDFDGSSANFASFGSVDDSKLALKARIFTQELQILSNDDTWGAEHFKWIVGGFFLHSVTGFVPLPFNLAGLDNVLQPDNPLPQVPLLATITDLITALGSNVPVTGVNLDVTGSLKTTSISGFMQGTYSPLDWLDITLGARLQHEKRTVFDAGLAAEAVILGADLVNLQATSYPEQTTVKTNFSPKISVSVKPAEHVLTYASYQRAFKSGSFNIVNLTSAPTYIKPETVDAFEAGFKSDLFNRRLRVNAAAFETIIHDQQVQFVSLTSGGVVNFENAKKATVKGVEGEVIWQIAGGLQANVGATYLKSRYNDFTDAGGYNAAGFSTTGNNFSGNTIARNPKFSAVTGLNYSQPVDDGVFEPGVDLYYNDGYYFDAQNSIRQDSFYLLNARASYLYTPWDLRLTAFCDNITSQKHYIYETQFDTGIAGKLAQPVTYGLRINYQFGG